MVSVQGRRDCQPAQRRANSGLGLLEIVAGIGIILTLSAVAFPRIGRYWQLYALDSATAAAHPEWLRVTSGYVSGDTTLGGVAISSEDIVTRYGGDAWNLALDSWSR